MKPQQLSQFELGSEAVLHLFLEWVKLRRAEFSLTCKIRSLCVHERARVENLQGAAMRVESSLFAAEIPYMSSHYRTHVLHRLKMHGDILARDSTSELLNQENLRRERQSNNFYNFGRKAQEQWRTQLTRLGIRKPPQLRESKSMKTNLESAVLSVILENNESLEECKFSLT